MKRAFRDAYNRELALLKERSTEFAQDYPGLAERLGGLMEENLDPAVAGLLEGSAFLAARVQLKMSEEFRGFTHEFLDQIFPDALAPTPSVMMMQAKVPPDQSHLLKGVRFGVGEYLDARYTDADKRVSCRFALAAPLTLWPLSITRALYHGAAGPVGALGQDIDPATKAGLVIELGRLGPSGQPEEGLALSDVQVDTLPIHFKGPMGEAAALYEQVHSNVARVSLRWLDPQGDAVFRRLPPDCIQQIGFDEDERLFPHNTRLFSGFAQLRDAFVFPRKFIGMRLTGLRDALRGIDIGRVQIIIELDTPNARLAQRFEPGHLGLHCVTAVNLFEEISSQVRIDRKRHEYVVTPNSSPSTHYELHALREVWAYYAGHQTKVKVHPLYALPEGGQDPRQTLYYTTRRKQRRLTVQERRFGSSRTRYRGTETFISVYDPPDQEPVQRLQVKALCSNRHLPEYLPIAQGKDDFYMCEDQNVTLACVAGPTPPRDSLADLDAGAAHRAQSGETYWRLISYLSLNAYGLEGRTPHEAAAALREMLSLFADLSESVTEAQISGLQMVETRPVTRTVAHGDGYHPARGVEVSITFDEDEFEGSGIVVLGAVLDRFLSEYAAVNSFTQVVIRSHQRGHVKTWPPRSGSGPLL